MKYKISNILLGLCCSSSILLSGCIEETFPTNGATEDVISSSDKGLEAKLWAIPAFAVNHGTVSTSVGYDWGYGSIMHIRDVMTQDMPIYASSYDHYSAWECNYYIGPAYLSTQFIWNYYWKFVQTTNKLLAAIPESDTDPTHLGYKAAGHAYRAFLYLDMAQMYEFLPNDKTSDVNNSGNDVTGLTVPIVRENITEEQARNNPRVKRDAMVEFIMEDLNAAEANIDKLSFTDKTLPNLAVVYGLKARLYMWIGNYGEAKNYARKAIDASGCTPVKSDAWVNPSSGFNELSSPAWMWGVKAMKENDVVQKGIINWTSWASNEAQYGYAAAGPISSVDVQMYSRIDDRDFRKLSWVAPKGTTLFGKNSFVDDSFGAYLQANYPLASLKFRPGSGNTTDFNVGSATAFPLMRVEEMYFIEAEAAAHLNASEGKTLVEKFMQTYRYPEYSCSVSSSDDVVEEIVFQKRVELWGEGLTFFDIKRLNMSVIRGYEGTIFRDDALFNTNGRPAWMNFCIVQTEENNNEALRGFENPDPSDVYDLWMAPEQ